MYLPQADIMNTEVMENAGNAAARRRELRRKRILQDSEERMKKLMGHQRSEEGITFQESTTENMSTEGYRRNPIHLLGPDIHFERSEFDSYGPSGRPNYSEPLIRENLFINERKPQNSEEVQPAFAVCPKSFTRRRLFLFALVGILVRLLLLCSIGETYIQSIINPFVFLEVAVFGYQRGVGMDLGSGIRGGLLLSTLVLSGVRSDVITAYKGGVSVVTAVVDDFMLYFFTFVVCHLTCMFFT